MHGSSDAACTTPSETFDNQTAVDMIAPVIAGNRRLVKKRTRFRDPYRFANRRSDFVRHKTHTVAGAEYISRESFPKPDRAPAAASFSAPLRAAVRASISAKVVSCASKSASINAPFASRSRTIFGRNRQWRSAISPWCQTNFLWQFSPCA